MEIAFPKRPRERGPAPDWAALGLLALVLLGACSSLGGPSRGVAARPSAAATVTANEVAPRPTRSAGPFIPLTFGPAVFEVSESAATVWARGSAAAVLHVSWRGGGHEGHASIPTDEDRDWTAAVRLRGLPPATKVHYRAWLATDSVRVAGEESRGAAAQFVTAPAASSTAPLRFAWSGDVGGQNVCRDAALGYPLFQRIRDSAPQFFIGLGDMIYADSICRLVGLHGNRQVARTVGNAVSLEDYRAHWRYNREDAGLAALLASIPYYAVWDDHEVVNNWGPTTDVRTKPPYVPGAHLVLPAKGAFLDYNPIGDRLASAPAGNASPLYRAVRWGKHLEVFFLDARQYRSPNSELDSTEKSMLGIEQREWFLRAAKASDATWKVVVSSVPIGIAPGGIGPKDAWANGASAHGFETELTRILYELRDGGSKNILWLTTDVHFAAVTEYTPFTTTPEFRIIEAVAGPISAGFGSLRKPDKTFHPTTLFEFAAPKKTGMTYDQAREWFNFGLVEIDPQGTLTLEYRNEFRAVSERMQFAPRR
jgi:alkaline phosphatase D